MTLLLITKFDDNWVTARFGAPIEIAIAIFDALINTVIAESATDNVVTNNVIITNAIVRSAIANTVIILLKTRLI